MEYIKDYTEQYADYEAREARNLARYPVCVSCGESITDDCYYEIEGEILCEDCMNERYGRSTYDYVND